VLSVFASINEIILYDRNPIYGFHAGTNYIVEFK